MEAVWLHPDNRIEQATAGQLKTDDVVLLGLDQKNEPSILGNAGAQITPTDDPHAWADDPLAYEFTDVKRLIAMIGYCQGGLPVTIDSVDGERVRFSRRLQHAPALKSLRPGRLVCGRVLGLLSDQTSFLFRVGSWLLRVGVENIVCGLPEGLAKAAASALFQRDEPVWLRVDAAGQLRRAQAESCHETFRVRAVAMLSGRNGLGVIVRPLHGGTFHWLSASKMGWVDLNERQLSRHVVAAGQILEVTNASAGLSVIDVPNLRRFFESMEPGKRVRVTPLERPSDQGTRYLACVYTNGVPLELHSNRTLEILEDEAAEPFFAEVTHRTWDPPRLQVVEPDSRTYEIHLPLWVPEAMRSREAIPGRFKKYGEWYNAGLADGTLWNEADGISPSLHYILLVGGRSPRACCTILL